MPEHPRTTLDLNGSPLAATPYSVAASRAPPAEPGARVRPVTAQLSNPAMQIREVTTANRRPVIP